MIDIDTYLSKEYPHLEAASFFDHKRFCPVSKSQIESVKTLGHKLHPSPHSSEEQSDYDRAIVLFREKMADMFGTNQVNYAVVIFPDCDTAINYIFESFPWKAGFNLSISNEFGIDVTPSLVFPKRFNVEVSPIEKTHSKSLICVPYNEKSLEKIHELRKGSSGTRYFLCDATPLCNYELPDLSSIPLDFVLLNMKQFCGVDMCVAMMKLESADLLVPLYYGGGAVAFSCARKMTHINFRSHTKRFENGTPAVLPLLSAFAGICIKEDINKMVNQKERIKTHTMLFYEAAKSTNKFQVEMVNDFTCTLATVDAEASWKFFIEKKVYFGLENGKLIATLSVLNSQKDIRRFLDVCDLLN